MGYYKESDFKDWLEADNNRWNDPSSVSSYKSGVGSMIDWVNNNKGLWKTVGSTKFQGFECYLQNINCGEDRDTFFSAVLNIIQKEIDKSPENKSTLQNYKSYLSAFEEFFKDEQYSQSSFTDAQRKLLRQNSSCATYSQEELINEFQGRILTQDRISQSKKILFPIRLITRIWNEESKDWAKGVCENIWIILQNTSSKTTVEKQIKEIKTLRIEKTGEVKVTINKDENEYIMCTSYSDPHEFIKIDKDKATIKYIKKRSEKLCCDIPKEGVIIDKNKNIRDSENKIILWHVKPVNIKRLGDIAIDHDIPISQVLIDKERQLKDLSEISERYRSLSQEYGLPVTAKEVNNFCKKYNGDQTMKNIGFPKDDMALIGKCKLVLMGKDENSQKSDS